MHGCALQHDLTPSLFAAAVGLLLRLQQREPAPARDGAADRALQVGRCRVNCIFS